MFSFERKQDKEEILEKTNEKNIINNKENIISSKQTKKNTSKSENCYAGTDNHNYSCYSKTHLLKLTKDWNNFYKSNYKGGLVIHKNHKELKSSSNENENNLLSENEELTITELWTNLDTIIQKFYNCNNEMCWSSLPFIKNKSFLLKRFKPFKPLSWNKNNRTWLSTPDIENVLEQYQDKYSDFKFLGVSPLDWNYKFSDNSCVTENLCNLDLIKLYNNGIKKIGIIFNLDKHHESGSHWVALFSDLIEREVYYYDSYGYRPPYYIRQLMNHISNEGKNVPVLNEKKDISNKGICLDNCDNLNNMLFSTYYNDIRHQYKNSECGVYSMHFIISFLEGKTFIEIINNIISDDNINKLRDVYYQSKLN
jgi:hypothetical protein